MMKWVFVLALLVVGAFGGWLGLNVVHWWQTDMFHTQRVMPGEASYAMPLGSVPRRGGQLYYSPAERDAAAARRNPVAVPVRPPTKVKKRTADTGRTRSTSSSISSTGTGV